MRTFKLLTLMMGFLMLLMAPTSTWASCNITNLVVKNDVANEDCMGAGMDMYYKLRLNIKGTDLPNTVNKVVVGGDTYTGDDIQVLGGSTSSKVKIRLFVRSRGRVNVPVFVESEGGCSYTLYNAFDEPVCADNPCDITDIFEVRLENVGLCSTFEVVVGFEGVGLPIALTKLFVTYDGVEYKFYNSAICFGPGNSAAVITEEIPVGTGGTITKVFIEAESGCTYTLNTSVVGPPICVGPRFAAQVEGKLVAYPNPATNSFQVVVNEIDNPELTIFNTLGEAVLRSTVSRGIPVEINSAGFEPGLYIIQANNGVKAFTKKLIIK